MRGDIGSADTDLLRAWRLQGQRRGLQPSTLRRREDNLRCLARWWGQGVLTIEADDIERFLDERTIGARTRYHWLSFIHTFFDFAVRQGLAQVDPTTKIDRPRLRRLLPRPITDADLAFAIRAGDRTMQAWLMLAALEGFRCMELAALTREDVLESWRPQVIVAHGKGAKDRTVPLHPHVAVVLDRLPMPRRGPVFVNPTTRRPWTAAQVSRRISEHFDGLGMAWTAHTVRHHFGSKLYAATKDIRLVQETMGHESPVTTSGYVQWSQTQAAKAIAALPVPDEERIIEEGGDVA